MGDLRSFVNLIIKQTCRNFAYECERGWRSCAEEYSATNKYTLEFLKLLHENPDKYINEIIGVPSSSNDSPLEEPNNKRTLSDVDKEKLLTFFNNVHSMNPRSCKLWIDLEHYMLYVYRNAVSATPLPTKQHLSKSIRSQMKSIITELTADDKSQLYLRLFALLREYVIFAHWHFNQITDNICYLPKLFDYYEAFMNAAETLNEVFKDFEVVLKQDYTLTWVDFNMCIFIHYFYELNDVQTKLCDIENGISFSEKSATMYNLLRTRFSDLHGKWFTKKLGVKNNTKETDKLEENNSQLENEILNEVQNILSQNFWIRRSPEKKSVFESVFVERKMFMLLGDKILKISEPNLDKTGQCICEHCLIIKYKYVVAKKSHMSASRLIPCPICEDTVALDDLEQHINGHCDGKNTSNDSDDEQIAINGEVIKTNIMSEIKALFNSNITKELQIQFKDKTEIDSNSIPENKMNGHLEDVRVNPPVENDPKDSLSHSEHLAGNSFDLPANGSSIDENQESINLQVNEININDFPCKMNDHFNLLANELAVNQISDDSTGNWDVNETSSSLDPNDRSGDVDNDLSSDFDYDMELPNFSSAKSIIDYVSVNELPNFNDFVESPNYNDFMTFQIALDNHIKNKKEGKANDALDALYFQEFLKHSMYIGQNRNQGQSQAQGISENNVETNLLAENKIPEASSKMFIKPTAIPKEQDSAPRDLEKKVEIVKPKPPLPNLELSNAATTVPTNKQQPTLPCGHSCKHGEEVKSDLKKVCQGICDHHSKDSKKCDCTYCEVFGTTRAPTNPKDTLTRNRLRIRLLNQRKAKSKPPATDVTTVTLAKPETVVPNLISNQSNILTTLANDLSTKFTTGKKKKGTGVPEELEKALHYIEGEDRSIIAEKKAAKKARQRQKKEEERLRKEEEERKKQEEEKLIERMRALELAKESAGPDKSKASKKERKKNAKSQQPPDSSEQSKTAVFEETIPALVTIQRSHESNTLLTIQFQDRTQSHEELLASLVRQNNSQIQAVQPSITESKKSKKNKPQQTQQQSAPAASNSKTKKTKSGNDKSEAASVIAKEVKITLSISSPPLPNGSLGQHSNSTQLPLQSSSAHVVNAASLTVGLDKESNVFKDSKKNKKSQNKENETKSGLHKKAGKDDNRNRDNPSCELSNLRLPPGITITKVNGPVSNRNYKTTDLQSAQQTTANATSVPVSKSGVIVVDTEKLIQQTTPPPSNSGAAATVSRKSRKKNKKKQGSANATNTQQGGGQDIVTLKNPIFQPYHNARPEGERVPDLNQYQASIFRNDNGMVTIRSSRLQQSLNSGTPIPNLLSDLKPVIGPDVATPYVAPCNFPEPNRISPFNAQEILSGLPGIEITKVDKCSAKSEIDNKKSCQAAEVSIIPTHASNGNAIANANSSNANVEKFNLDKEDWHYDSVFTPKDVLEDDMDADEIELEAFKRFCQQSVPPKKKEKVAHLNVKDIVLKKKNDQNSV